MKKDDIFWLVNAMVGENLARYKLYKFMKTTHPNNWGAAWGFRMEQLEHFGREVARLIIKLDLNDFQFERAYMAARALAKWQKKNPDKALPWGDWGKIEKYIF